MSDPDDGRPCDEHPHFQGDYLVPGYGPVSSQNLETSEFKPPPLPRAPSTASGPLPSQVLAGGHAERRRLAKAADERKLEPFEETLKKTERQREVEAIITEVRRALDAPTYPTILGVLDGRRVVVTVTWESEAKK